MRFFVRIISSLLVSAVVFPSLAQDKVPSQSPRQLPSPMSLASSPAQLERFLAANGSSPFLTFPEKRENPIRLFDAIPEIWTTRGTKELTYFQASAQPGECFVFQIGVFAHQKAIHNLSVLWTDLKGNTVIAAKDMTCFNTSGIDFQGRAFGKTIDVARGRVQPLWFGVQIPPNAQGRFQTRVTLEPSNETPVSIDVVLNVSGKPVPNFGFNRGRSLSRLAWLNTKLGSDDTTTQGYEPIRRTGRELRILGRDLLIAPDGLPARFRSYFEPSNQFLIKDGTELLQGPLAFVIETEEGNTVRLEPGTLRFTEQTPSGVAWDVMNTSSECEVRCLGRMEFDGFLDFGLALKAKKSIRIRDVRLEVPMRKERALYMMGLNYEGGLRPREWRWQWDTTRNQDMLWMGNVNGGIRIKWKAENYRRPLINIYYALGRLELPPSWGNQGKGGVHVSEEGDRVLVRAYSGPREMVAGQFLHFDFELLLTPFKVVDPHIKYHDRYFHEGGTNAASKIAKAEEAGANIINIHHAEDLYPFINYPYLDENVAALKSLVADAHKHDKHLKVYYTTRELTKNLPEFWALWSLNGEIIYPGPGDSCKTIINPNGPDEWLRKNLKERYIPAWLNVIKEGPFTGELDLSVITTPDSRLNNFYVGGLNWMLENIGIDGVYVDDSALDRLTVRRARKLIDRHRPQGRIDFHSWNHFNDMAGFTNCLNLYMDLLPYFDLVWIGEGRDYDRMPDHWLIEVSGIPFGLPGQMLAGGGNPWRGMVYGITNRAGWGGDPTKLWKFWDTYRIDSKQMIGYWDANSPVVCSNDSIKATLYMGSDQSIIALGNWGKLDQQCSVSVDWKKLGYDPTTTSIVIPSVQGFQEEKALSSLEQMNVPGGKGFLIVLQPRSHQ